MYWQHTLRSFAKHVFTWILCLRSRKKNAFNSLEDPTDTQVNVIIISNINLKYDIWNKHQVKYKYLYDL